ncbi:hypothetical protein APHAL10511_000386 [Amanita phalloides]|nr:hypothetical protein APHAL10511_000386 [Amanita phalloides]
MAPVEQNYWVSEMSLTPDRTGSLGLVAAIPQNVAPVTEPQLMARLSPLPTASCQSTMATAGQTYWPSTMSSTPEHTGSLKLVTAIPHNAPVTEPQPMTQLSSFPTVSSCQPIMATAGQTYWPLATSSTPEHTGSLKLVTAIPHNAPVTEPQPMTQLSSFPTVSSCQPIMATAGQTYWPLATSSTPEHTGSLKLVTAIPQNAPVTEPQPVTQLSSFPTVSSCQPIMATAGQKYWTSTMPPTTERTPKFVTAIPQTVLPPITGLSSFRSVSSCQSTMSTAGQKYWSSTMLSTIERTELLKCVTAITQNVPPPPTRLISFPSVSYSYFPRESAGASSVGSNTPTPIEGTQLAYCRWDNCGVVIACDRSSVSKHMRRHIKDLYDHGLLFGDGYPLGDAPQAKLLGKCRTHCRWRDEIPCPNSDLYQSRCHDSLLKKRRKKLFGRDMGRSKWSKNVHTQGSDTMSEGTDDNEDSGVSKAGQPMEPYNGSLINVQSLTKHICATHLFSLMVTCKGCDRRFSRMDAYGRHLKDVHGGLVRERATDFEHPIT